MDDSSGVDVDDLSTGPGGRGRGLRLAALPWLLRRRLLRPRSNSLDGFPSRSAEVRRMRPVLADDGSAGGGVGDEADTGHLLLFFRSRFPSPMFFLALWIVVFDASVSVLDVPFLWATC
jgi:hypothetical protein